MNKCVDRKFCAECGSSDTCGSEKGYCEITHYCAECQMHCPYIHIEPRAISLPTPNETFDTEEYMR